MEDCYKVKDSLIDTIISWLSRAGQDSKVQLLPFNQNKNKDDNQKHSSSPTWASRVRLSSEFYSQNFPSHFPGRLNHAASFNCP